MINIAIDGPAGAGKSTVAKKIAHRLGNGYTYIDTGALYRGITYWLINNNININDINDVNTVIKDINLEFTDNKETLINGENFENNIRTPLVTNNVSIVASYASIRKLVLDFLQDIAKRGGVIMDGRDIGTYVMPDAGIKIFLTASIDARASRRTEELSGKNYDVSLEKVKEEIKTRDNFDMNRKEAPLVQAKDAIVIDTTHLNIEEVVDKILNCCVSKIQNHNSKK